MMNFKYLHASDTSIAESAGNRGLSSCEKNLSVQCKYMNFLDKRKRTSGAVLYAIETGRSMIEMLGVLAIIGVLSVGAIAGYQKAMMKHKLNKQAGQLTQLIGGALQYSKSFEFSSNTNLIPYLIKLNIVPEEMVTSQVNIGLFDVFGTRIAISYNTDKNTHMFFYLDLQEHLAYEICRNIITIAKNFSSELNYAGSWSDYGTSESLSFIYYGQQTCTSGKKCLKDLTLDDIGTLCQSHTGKSDVHIKLVWTH